MSEETSKENAGQENLGKTLVRDHSFGASYIVPPGKSEYQVFDQSFVPDSDEDACGVLPGREVQANGVKCPAGERTPVKLGEGRLTVENSHASDVKIRVFYRGSLTTQVAPLRPSKEDLAKRSEERRQRRLDQGSRKIPRREEEGKKPPKKDPPAPPPSDPAPPLPVQ